MEQSRLHELEEQCIQECAPPCTSYCPVHVDVRRLAALVSEGDFSSALKTFHKAVPFPEIISRICDQPCQAKCNRKTLGGAIRVVDLERACVQYAQENPQKITLLPKKKSSVAVIGGGLNGLTAAFELSKKGYRVSLFEKQQYLGGRLWNFTEEQLPRDILTKETHLIIQTGVDIHLGEGVDGLDKILAEFDAVYLSTGAIQAFKEALNDNPDDTLQVDTQTFQSRNAKVFTNGFARDGYSPILSVSTGRRAAISVDRFLQQVSLTAARVNEGAYETKLFTSIATVEPLQQVIPGEPGIGYTPEEAQGEARRCLQCECLECVKVCEYLHHYGSYPKKYVREIYNNLSIIMRTRTANKFINSCSQCGLCAEVCPTQFDMGRVIKETRQRMVKTSKMPASAFDFALRDMAFSNSPKFAVTLRPQKGQSCKYMFFPGCQLAASNPDYIPLVYQSLSSVIPNLGVMLRCCGAPADWAGEEELFKQSLEIFKCEWEIYGRPKLILACSSCQTVFEKNFPDIPIQSLWEVYGEYGLYHKREDLVGKRFVIHDPCTSRHLDLWQESARAGLAAVGVSFEELEASRQLTECCGYGGVTWLANPELAHDIIQRRIGEDPGDYLTYCVMCRDLFAQEGKKTYHLLDILYGENLQQLAQRPVPDYSQRHENRIRAKQKMEKLINGKEEGNLEAYETYTLFISQEIRTNLSARLILVEDIQKVIEHAETSNERFVNQDNGHSLAYFKPNLITYWVEYTKEGDTYRIHDAYSHRMNFEGDASL